MGFRDEDRRVWVSEKVSSRRKYIFAAKGWKIDKSHVTDALDVGGTRYQREEI